MKLAEVKNEYGHTELHHDPGLGYSVVTAHGGISSNIYFIPTRQEAEKHFLWYVGYEEWKEASEQAFKAHRDRWLAAHPTLDSVGAVDTRP